MSKRVQGLRFVFTINNFTYEEEEAVRGLQFYPTVKYLIAEEEHLDEGTPHIQGYVRFASRIDRNKLEKLLGGESHIEIARGSEKDNIEYCSKEDQVIVRYGEPQTKEGKQLDELMNQKDIEALQIIKDMRELKEEEFEAIHPNYYKSHVNQVRDFRHDYLTKNPQIFDGNLKSKNLWIWGKAGVGKSRVARTGMALYHIYNKPWNKWWNGYMPDVTERVVIDDWPKAPQGDMLVQQLKIWGDRYPFTAEVKGAHIFVSPTFQLIITSNYSIEECFTNVQDIEAIRRRFNEVWMTDSSETLDHWLEIPIDQ